MSAPAKQVPRAGRLDPWALLATALVSVIVVLVNYVSSRRYERFDLTSEQLFTLSDRTEQALKRLPRSVDVYLFMSSGEPNYHELRELLTRYKSKSDKVVAHFVDPDREPTKFRALADKYGVRVSMRESGETEAELAALVTSGEKRWSITRDDLVDFDMDSLGEGASGAKVNVKTEQALTSAIVQVTSGRSTKVCVTEGHGEWPLEGSERSLSALKQELERENIEVEALATRGKSELPKSCDAIFVVGPEKAFAEDESKALKSYLDAGGNLLLALDPVIANEQIQETGLEGLGQAYGVRIDRDVVVELDTARLLSASPIEHFVATDFSDHPMMRPLVALRAPVVMQLARSVTVSKDGEAEPLFKSSDKAYGETQLTELTAGDDLKAGEGDVSGPLALGAVVDTRPEKPGEGGAKRVGGRMVVIGDSEWLASTYLEQPQVANVDLLGAVTGYLTEREALVSIAPRKINAQAVMITEDGLFGIFLRVVVLMPLASLVLGLGIWWQRRS